MRKRRNVEKSKSRNRNAATVYDLFRAVHEIAPSWAAAEWDNVGLIVGDLSWRLRRSLLTIDLTSDVLDEAVKLRCDSVIAYHPPIFKPTKRMVLGWGSQDSIAAEALSRHIAIYSPHTALDTVPGGTNDVLADLCGMADTRPFRPLDLPKSFGQCKLVVFVPENAVDKVADALFKAGCGHIGDYERCSFRSGGHGTFFGTDSTNPRVGTRDRLERVAEVRVEVVCYEDELAEAIAAMKQAHPYETPAYDIYKLQPIPIEGVGQGRIGRFAKPTTLANLARSLKRKTGAANVSIVGNPKSRLTRGLVCVGAAGELPLEFPGLGNEKDVVITGEFRHHDALEYQRRGVCAIALGHWASERPVLKPLAARLRKALPSVEFIVSRADRDPYVAI
ncbi:MAG: Nif3-like dinuclear metal center hexameric protein [Planctomycetes bacterium]|nr:Nif3-like dinuclear metal center hexameric protein [Planctomycetota bacterium]